MMYAMFYSQTTTPPPANSIVVTSITMNGTSIFGVQIDLRIDGSTIRTGYTPVMWTITRRLSRLVDERGVYLQGVPNFQNFAGLSCVFLIMCPEPTRKKKVDQDILSNVSRIEIVNTSSEDVSTFVTMFENLSQVDGVTKYLRSLDGVSIVKTGIMKELIAVQDWLEDEIEKRIAQSSAA